MAKDKKPRERFYCNICKFKGAANAGFSVHGIIAIPICRSTCKF
jgi:hypothetical protein